MPSPRRSAVTRQFAILSLLFLATLPARADDQVATGDVPVTRLTDVVYGRKFGTALTMDVFLPQKNANRKAIIMVCSGAWVSDHSMIDAIQARVLQPYLNRGFTMFAVCHGSNPRYTIPDILLDLHRSVRFIRSRASEYQIDPDAIGIQGFSSGGHLALMQALAGDLGDPKAKDPIDRFSSRVQAAVVGAPPSDFLNYGKEGEVAIGNGRLAGFHSAFAFTRFDPKANTFTPITDENEILEIGRKISPANFVSSDDPPIFIIHGDADGAVPIQQSETLIEKLKAVGVPTHLRVKKGVGHFWNDHEKDRPLQEEWFDRWLQPASVGSEAPTGNAQKDKP